MADNQQDDRITDHAYTPSGITVWHAAMPAEPICAVCGRLRKMHAR